MNQKRHLAAFLLLFLTATGALAQQPAAGTDQSRLTIDSLFTFRPKRLAEVGWQSDGGGYLLLEPSANRKDAQDIVRYDAVTGARSVLVSAEKLIPPASSSPIAIEEFEFSENGDRLLIFTNSERVWRSN